MSIAKSQHGPRPLLHGELTDQILAAAIEVHRTLGPGLLESVYEACLAHELHLRGLRCATQVPIPVEYKGIKLPIGFRLDMLVEDKVVVENKTVEALTNIDEAKLLTYLRMTGMRVGLLINYNVTLLKNGVVRRAL